MEREFSVKEVMSMIKLYYTKAGDEVRVSYSYGKVVRQKKHLPPCNVLNFSVSRKVVDEHGNEVWESIPMSDETLETILSSVLDQANFDIEAVEYTNRGINIKGNYRSLNKSL